MRLLAALLLSGISFSSNSNDREIQRALIQRDQQSAEFAARGVEARRALETLHSNQLRDAGRPLNPDPVIAKELLPYERQQMAREREMFPPLSEPRTKRSVPGTDLAKPLPLPGSDSPPSVVVPISAPSIGG